jgi:hypothetical protein
MSDVDPGIYQMLLKYTLNRLMDIMGIGRLIKEE